MSIYRNWGLLRKPSGLLYEITEQLKVVDLRPLKRIEYKFDPFHESAKHVRELSYHLSIPKIRDTNYKCVFKTNIVCDRSPPEVNCKLGKDVADLGERECDNLLIFDFLFIENGKEIVFKVENLTLLEILEEFNKIVLPLVPPPEETTTVVPKTKSQKRK